MGHGLNIRLNNKTSCCREVYSHYLCHTLVFHCIFAGEYSRVSSLLTIRRIFVATVNKIVELNMSLVLMLRCSIQFS